MRDEYIGSAPNNKLLDGLHGTGLCSAIFVHSVYSDTLRTRFFEINQTCNICALFRLACPSPSHSAMGAHTRHGLRQW